MVKKLVVAICRQERPPKLATLAMGCYARSSLDTGSSFQGFYHNCHSRHCVPHVGAFDDAAASDANGLAGTTQIRSLKLLRQPPAHKCLDAAEVTQDRLE